MVFRTRPRLFVRRNFYEKLSSKELLRKSVVLLILNHSEVFSERLLGCSRKPPYPIILLRDQYSENPSPTFRLPTMADTRCSCSWKCRTGRCRWQADRKRIRDAQRSLHSHIQDSVIVQKGVQNMTKATVKVREETILQHRIDNTVGMKVFDLF